jgi:hypothetical protein
LYCYSDVRTFTRFLALVAVELLLSDTDKKTLVFAMINVFLPSVLIN